MRPSPALDRPGPGAIILDLPDSRRGDVRLEEWQVEEMDGAFAVHLWRRPNISEPVLNYVIPAKAGTQVA